MGFCNVCHRRSQETTTSLPQGPAWCLSCGGVVTTRPRPLARGLPPEQSSLLHVRSSHSRISVPRAVPPSNPRVVLVSQGPKSPAVSLRPRLWHIWCARPMVVDPGNEELWRVGKGPSTLRPGRGQAPFRLGAEDSPAEREGPVGPGARSSMNESPELLWPWFCGLLCTVPETG